jgi:hypothetical protein
MTRNLSIPFTKKFFAQKSPLLRFNVCAQIKAIFIKFQKKNNFDPVSHTFGLNLNLKKCHIFDQMSNFQSGSLLNQVNQVLVIFAGTPPKKVSRLAKYGPK